MGVSKHGRTFLETHREYLKLPIGWRSITVFDFFSLSFEFSDPFVLSLLALGVFVAIGLIIREKAQGGERGI
jgi:hypothetical protein